MSSTKADIDRIRERYRRFAFTECRGYSNLYYDLSMAVAADDSVCRFIAQMPVIQPNLFFASIQYLSGQEAMPATASELAYFVRSHQSAIAELMKARRTQTNEVGRCAAILPALPTGPLALLEVGASAGLCLLLDAYAYDYSGLTLGASPVVLPCAVEGEHQPPIPNDPPEIVWRAGLDLRPVDLSDDRDAHWLLSCVWADHAERRERLEAAMDMGKESQPEIYCGDLVADLPAILEKVPLDATLVVFHSAVLCYVSPDGRGAFADVLASASQERTVCWISNEAMGVVPELSAIAARLPTRDFRFLLGRAVFRGGARQDELLAFSHPHGNSLEWLSPAVRAEWAN